MISSVFGYQAKCAENIVKAYEAFKTGDTDALSELSGTFAKETAKGTSKICLRAIGGWLIETLASDSPAEGAVKLANVVFDSKLHIATTIVNGVATVATAAATVPATLSSYGDMYHAARHSA